MKSLAIFLLLATLLSTSHAEFDVDNPIRLLRQPRYGRNASKINCQSFRVGAEAYNLRNWETVPSYCKSYIKSYLTGKQYNLDIEAMAMAAIYYANHVPLPRDLRTNVWVFDLDETLISNLGYFNSSDFQYGTLPLNHTLFDEWIASENSTAPALSAVKSVYDTVLSVAPFKTVIISGEPESFRAKRTSDLVAAGYSDWLALIFRGEEEMELTNEEFKTKKRTELVTDFGYRIVGNVGDQWSDLIGKNEGMRTFKVPNPVYYQR